MTVRDVEEEALKLSANDRAQLARRLLFSLEELSQEEIDDLWAEEAARRDAEMDADPTLGRPVNEALRDLRSRLA